MKLFRNLQPLPLPPAIDTQFAEGSPARKKKVLTLFGTRPEIIKLAPVLRQFVRLRPFFTAVNVTSGQHSDLLAPFIELLNVQVHRELRAMDSNQTGDLCGWILQQLSPLLDAERPDLILVQGDTTTALAGALAGVQRRIPVAHVEAGLRSGNLSSPYPEEINRTLITKSATYHFAATSGNRDSLLSEGVPAQRVFITGNPIVDTLHAFLRNGSKSPRLKGLLMETSGLKRIVLTAHRRESFGSALAANLQALCRFVKDHEDVALVFPVHPNPNVKIPANKICTGHPRVFLTEPLDYRDFISLLSNAWLVVSDSGGIQEEVPSLGRPLLIMRENTERPECINTGIARLVGGRPESLTAMLEECYRPGSWTDTVGTVKNPFGNGDSGRRIATCVATLLGNNATHLANPSLPLSTVPAPESTLTI